MVEEEDRSEHDQNGMMRRLRDRDQDLLKLVRSQRTGNRAVPATQGASEMLTDPENFSLEDSERTGVLNGDQ